MLKPDIHKIVNSAGVVAVILLQLFGSDLGLVKDPSVKVQVVRPDDAPPGEVVPIRTRQFKGRSIEVTVTESDK